MLLQKYNTESNRMSNLQTLSNLRKRVAAERTLYHTQSKLNIASKYENKLDYTAHLFSLLSFSYFYRLYFYLKQGVPRVFDATGLRTLDVFA